MRQYKLLLCLFVIATTAVEAKITFGSKHSAIKVSGSGKLHLAENITDVDGTVLTTDNGEITADATKIIDFEKGILESNDTEINLSATYDPNASAALILNGNDSLRAEPGTVVEEVTVSGLGNMITGQPLFSSPIVFDNGPGDELTVALHARLNQNIELNGGKLILGHDLELSDGINIINGGTIALNNNRLTFGSKELTHISNITWESANAIFLEGKNNLASVDTYSGINTINGNGNILDLTSRGTIFVEDNSTLYLTDLVLKGLGLGGLVLGGPFSRVVMSNVDVELATNYTNTTGNIYVEGPSTFILDGNDWLFDSAGTLSVDGVVLWTDRRSTPTEDRGKVLFGNEATNYTSVNSGTIKEKVYLGDIVSIETLVNQNAGDIAILEEKVENNSNAIVNTWDLTVENSNAIINNWELTVENSNAIDECGCGGGGVAPLPWAGTFTTDQWHCDSGHLDPCEQIIIAGDLTLSGSGSMIVFSNPDMAQFIIQENNCVTLENLNLQNVNAKTFQFETCSCLKIKGNVIMGITEDIIFNASNIQLLDGATLTIYGIGGIRKIGFNDISTICDQCEEEPREARPSVVEDNKVFKLDNGTLVLKNIEITNMEQIGNHAGGTIALMGSSIINFDQDNARSFVIDGIDNLFRMLKNNIALTGSIRFGDGEHGVLHIAHKIPGPLEEQNIIFGDNLLYLTSSNGIAELVFDDDVVHVTNQGFNSFVVGENSFLGGRQVQILDHPIRQISTMFDQDDSLELTTNQTSAVEQASGFYVAPPPNPADAKPMPFIEPEGFTPGLVGFQVGNNGPRELIFRSILQEDCSETVYLEDTVARNFSVDATKDLMLILNGNSTINLADEDVVIKPNDTICVSGKNNVIRITKTLSLNSSPLFEEGSSLIFECKGDPGKLLLLPEGVEINEDAPIEIRIVE